MVTSSLEQVVSKTESLSTNGAGLRTYTFEDAYEGALAYFEGDKVATKSWVNKYALKDSYGKIYEMSPNQMHHRISRELARTESKYPNPMSEDMIFSLLRDFKYIIPQGSPMSGIGNNFQRVSISNCFVIGNKDHSDSYGGILKIDQEQIQLMKRRGGVGHDLSDLRPKGSPVMNSALNSTGIVSFMERYSNSTREVAQDGRRGALMLSLSIKHPDAEAFIDAKMDQVSVTGANISVRVDDDFMKAVVEGTDYVQQYPVNSKNPIMTKTVNARSLWEKIIHNAASSGEPGVLFWDTVLRESLPDRYADLGFETVSTNPCGEIPLCIDDSCRLLAINLFSYVENPFTAKARFNEPMFREHVQYAQRMMDDIVDLEIEKIDQILEKIVADPEDEDIKLVERKLWERIRNKAEEGRRTGLGITAEGDMLAALGIRYGSDESIRFSTNVHRIKAIEAYRSSVQMAKERGPFPLYDAEREKDNPFIERLRGEEPGLVAEMEEYGRRNIALLTIAPTGTTSIVAQTSSGIEPAFLIRYDRNRKVNPNDQNVKVDFQDAVGDSWERDAVFHHKFEDWLRINGHDVEKVKKMDEKQFAELISKSPYHRATANEIDWVQRVKLQGSVQQWVDHSISSTINLPKGTPDSVVAELYETAWKSGCKGVTVYVDGSRTGVLVPQVKDEKKEITRKELSDLVMAQLQKPRPRGGKIRGMTEKIETPFGDAFITFNQEGENGDSFPYETFINIGKAGGDIGAIMEGVGRLKSMLDRLGVDQHYIVSQLKGIKGETQKGLGPKKVSSLPDGIAKGMEEILSFIHENHSNGNGTQPDKVMSGNFCPECQGPLNMEEGCQKCPSCGFSRC